MVSADVGAGTFDAPRRHGAGALSLGAAAVAIGIDAGIRADWLSASRGFGAFTVLLVAYLASEIVALRVEGSRVIWINPVVLASVFTFALQYGITNCLYFFPAPLIETLGMPPAPTRWMNELMFLAVLSATAMWAGYRSIVGQEMGLLLRRSRALRRWLVTEAAINPFTVSTFLGVSLLARIWKLRLGVFGYAASPESLAATAGYREYFNLADSMGRLALAALALRWAASRRPPVIQSYVLWSVVGYEVVFGALSGFKSGMVIPFVIVGIVTYSQRRRFPIWMVPAIVVSMLAAYVIIEPFREHRNTSTTFQESSLESILEGFRLNRSLFADQGTVASVAVQVVSRLNLVYVGSLGIEHAETRTLRDSAPDFLGSTLLAPVHAIVPRILWPSKPIENTGGWYNREVLGNDSNTAMGMGPVTFLYFAGGLAGVVLGFLFLGILQRAVFDGLQGFGVGGWLVLLGLLVTISWIDSSFNSMIGNTFRTAPLLVIAQRLLLSRSASRGRS